VRMGLGLEGRQRLGIDLDGVLIDWTSVLRDAIRNTYGFHPDTSDYDAGLTREQFAEIHDKIAGDGGLPLCDVYYDNMETLVELAERHDIFYITHRRSMLGNKVVDGIIRDDTKYFLEVNDFPEGKLIFTHDKVSVCEHYNIPIMVEDHLETAQNFLGTITRCYLIDRPWNRHIWYPPHYRVLNLEAVVEIEKI